MVCIQKLRPVSYTHLDVYKRQAFVDYNGLQIDGDIEKVMSPLPIPDKFKAFKWNVIEVNGHDIDELHQAIEEAKAFTDGPTCIVMHTVKGKGVAEMEGQAGWHGKAPSEEQGVAFVNEIMGVQSVSYTHLQHMIESIQDETIMALYKIRAQLIQEIEQPVDHLEGAQPHHEDVLEPQNID